MPSSTQTTCAFFGATGGTANHALALALQAGHHCTALARTPQKLIDMLLADNVPRPTIDSHLQIIPGDVRDIDAVKQTLTRLPIDLIVSGIGRTTLFKNVDSTICGDAAATIVSALRDLQSQGQLAKEPHFVAVSTTGISDAGRDIPVMLVPLYHVLLKSPHEDKKVMEKVIREDLLEGEKGGRSVISGYTFVRPALLIDAGKPVVGLERVRVGLEEAPALGYAITRKEVGAWMFMKLIAGDVREYRNQAPNLVAATNAEMKQVRRARALGMAE